MKKVLLALAAAIFSLSLAVYIAPLAGAPWDTPVAVATFDRPIGADDPGEATELAKEAADAQAEGNEELADAVAEADEAAAEAADEACGPFVRCDPPGDFNGPGFPNDPP